MIVAASVIMPPSALDHLG